MTLLLYVLISLSAISIVQLLTVCRKIIKVIDCWCFMNGQNLLPLGPSSMYFDKLTYDEFHWSFEQHLLAYKYLQS